MKRIITILLTSAVLASCGGEKKESKSEQDLTKLKKERADLDDKIKKIEGAHPDTTKKPTPVTILEVQPGTFNGIVDVQSQITSDENVNANTQSPQPSVVRSILVHPGQRVSKGQVLASLDASTIEQQIEAVAPNIILAKSLYEKQQKLWTQQIGTEVQLLQAKAAYEGALKNRDALVAQKNLFRITSPINGIVDQVNIKVGDLTSAASPNGIRIVNNDKLKAEANLGESYLGKVKTGDPVTLFLPDTNDSIRTTLTYVAQAVDQASRSFNVQIRLGSNSKLHPNMSARMRIVNYQNKNVITIPVSVIQELSQGSVVYIAEGNKAKAVTVKKGRISNGQVEVLEGLKAGDRVITEGFSDLDNGAAIDAR